MADEKKALIYETVQRILGKLAADIPASKNTQALLRHSASKELGEDPELFGWLMENIPEELQSKGGDVSYAEQAIYTALIMYPGGPGYEPNKKSIAAAAKKAEIKREKLLLIETADKITDTRHPLRALMQLLKAKGQGLDYRTLAGDLYEWQFDKIRTARKWERDYARKEKTNEQ